MAIELGKVTMENDINLKTAGTRWDWEMTHENRGNDVIPVPKARLNVSLSSEYKRYGTDAKNVVYSGKHVTERN